MLRHVLSAPVRISERQDYWATERQSVGSFKWGYHLGRRALNLVLVSLVYRRLVLFVSPRADRVGCCCGVDMDDIWERGRRHVKISKLYLKGLWKRGPSIFVALAWSQVCILRCCSACLLYFWPMHMYSILNLFVAAVNTKANA